MAATTTLFMKGSIRSWIHYLKLRTENGTQQEHKEIALEILRVFKAHLPITSKALGWI
jgi:thymidylate synthase (FAD)